MDLSAGYKHIGLLNANGTNGKSLQLSSGKQIDVSVHDVIQLWEQNVSHQEIALVGHTPHLGHQELLAYCPSMQSLRSRFVQTYQCL